VADLEGVANPTFDLTTQPSFVFQIGGGIAYFFTKGLSLNLDGRWLFTDMGTDRSVEGTGVLPP
jgi:hypothetical protein